MLMSADSNAASYTLDIKWFHELCHWTIAKHSNWIFKMSCKMMAIKCNNLQSTHVVFSINCVWLISAQWYVTVSREVKGSRRGLFEFYLPAFFAQTWGSMLHRNACKSLSTCKFYWSCCWVIDTMTINLVLCYECPSLVSFTRKAKNNLLFFNFIFHQYAVILCLHNVWFIACSAKLLSCLCHKHVITCYFVKTL